MRWALLKQDCGSEKPVLTPRADDLHPVLGRVVAARRYPIISSPSGEARCVGKLLSFENCNGQASARALSIASAGGCMPC
jgi:hypothetical protein